ncbi:hypothetical protein BC629DRAFT_1261377, partial [Irpex lacteus]
QAYFDVVNLDHYDMVIGVPFMRRHAVVIDFGSNDLRVEGRSVTTASSVLTRDDIPHLREEWLRKYADIRGGVPAKLPPFREINHSIPLIDESKVYKYHLPKCPDALKPKLIEKINRYEEAGWWIRTNVPQAMPMMCLPK